MLEKKQWCQILLDKSTAHHTIVLSDGIHKDATIDYTCGFGNTIANLFIVQVLSTSVEITFPNDLLAQMVTDLLEYSILEYLKQAELNIEEFTGDKSQLVHMGTVESTCDELKDIATIFYDKSPQYCIFTFNSQHFCQKFIKETTSQTYEIDTLAEFMEMIQLKKLLKMFTK